MNIQAKQQIEEIVKSISNKFLADEIILFGSYAYGEPNEDSDIDLCIITDNKDIRIREMTKQIRKAIATIISIPVDILVYKKDEFYDRAMNNTTFEYKIINDGVKIYEQ